MAVFMLLFGVGDLIGAQNRARLEAVWLGASNRLFRSWQTAARNSARWWLALLSSASAFLLAGSVTAGLFYTAALVRKHYWAVAGTPLRMALVLLLSVFTAVAWWVFILPAYGLLATVVARFLSAPGEAVDPFEVRWARWFLHQPLKWPPGGGDSPAAPFIAGCNPILFVLVGALLAPLALVVILGRSFAYASLLLLWVPLLGPARALDTISRRTGAESYLKVGKYLLEVLAACLALYLLFR